ncbi:Brix domain-containing protein [Ochromonadaceae sp. CCMP2298]|nr:Brix domain-containing protein [Ochromonadaceae sp. CCMP2298]
MMAMRRAKEPVERTAKRVMLLKGTSSSETMNAVLQDLSLISKPNHKTMTRKNDILPFEDVNSLEFLGQKNDCGLFAFVSHTKKRPHNLVLGRFFDGHLLDMFEFGVDPETKKSLEDFSGEKKGLGSKPLLLFNGDQWANEPTYKAIQNLFIDFFRGDKTSKLCMKGVDHAIRY